MEPRNPKSVRLAQTRHKSNKAKPKKRPKSPDPKPASPTLVSRALLFYMILGATSSLPACLAFPGQQEAAAIALSAPSLSGAQSQPQAASNLNPQPNGLALAPAHLQSAAPLQNSNNNAVIQALEAPASTSSSPPPSPASLAKSAPSSHFLGHPAASSGLVASNTNTNNRARYRTMYACEDRQLIIDCEYGYTINLIRANFGRFSITQCNEQGHLDLSTDCMSPITFRVMRDRCQDKQKCSVNATSSIFGDRCPRTRKYLEVHFLCRPDEIEKVDLAKLAPQPQQPALQQPAPLAASHSNLAITPVLPANFPGHQRPLLAAARPFEPAPSSSSNEQLNLHHYQNQQPHQHPLLSLQDPQSAPAHHKSSAQASQQTEILTVINSEIITQTNAINIDSLNEAARASILVQQQQQQQNAGLPFVVTLRHLHSANMSNPRCLNWDQKRQQWLERGGLVLESNSTHTTCAFEAAGFYMLAMDHHHSSPGQPAPDDNSLPATPTPSLLDGNPLRVGAGGPPSGASSGPNGQSGPAPPSTGQFISSSIVRFFSIFGYLLVILFAALALITIAFVTSTSSKNSSPGGAADQSQMERRRRRRWSAGCMLKRLGTSLMPQLGFDSHPHPHYQHSHHQRRCSSSASLGKAKSAYGSAKLEANSAGRPHNNGLLDEHSANKDLLVINNQSGHQFIYSPAPSAATGAAAPPSAGKLLASANSPPASHTILTSSHQGALHHHTIQHQHSAAHLHAHQHQLYSSGTLSNLSALGAQSNNYYYGLVPQQQTFVSPMQTQQHQVQVQAHSAQVIPSSQQQHLISPIISSATNHRKSHLNLNISLTNALHVGQSAMAAQGSPSMREHIYECVDDDKKHHIIRSCYRIV